MARAWLRLRAWLGWGNPAEALQPFVRAEAVAWLLSLVLTSIVFGAFTVPHALPSRRVIALLWVAAFAIALSSPFGLRALSFRRLARRGANAPAVIVTGSCFACLPNYPWVFARIGKTQETAQWYNMPIDWDGVVASEAGTFELLVNPATGFVERLRRSGGSSHELTRTWDDDPLDNPTAVPLSAEGALPPKPTRAQRRELRRAARQRGMVWGVAPSYLGACGWALLATGVLTTIGLPFFLWAISAPDAIWATKAKPGVAELIIGLVALGIAEVVIALLMLRLWWRQRALRSKAKAVCEGVVEIWASFCSFYSGRDETLVRIALDDGTTRLFRVPKIWAYRVRRMGNRIRVTYDPALDLVEDVQTVIL